MAEPDTTNSEEEGKNQGSSKLVIILIAVIALLVGAFGFLVFTETGKAMIGLKPEEKATKKPEDLVYFHVPEMTVNLLPTKGKSGRSRFLKLVVKLELSKAEDMGTMEILAPRVIDQFQLYLRQLRVEDLEGAGGLQRLREELLRRANEVARPLKIRDILFEVMLIQ